MVHVDVLDNIPVFVVVSLHELYSSLCVAVLTVAMALVAHFFFVKYWMTPAAHTASASTVTTSKSKVEFIESPYSGDVDGNVRYLMLCGLDSFARGFMPTSTHGSMTIHPACTTFFVSDYDPQWDIFSRNACIQRGNELRRLCIRTVFYTDRGWSRGMLAAQQYCENHNMPYEERTVDLDKIASIQSDLLPREFAQALCNGEEYTHFLRSCNPSVVDN